MEYITFEQSGQTLTLTGKAPVQFSDGVPVSVTIDSTYSGATEIVLLTQPTGKSLPTRAVLELSTNKKTATGTLSRGMLTHAGLTLFTLAGKIGDAYLPTAACLVNVQRSVDPQSPEYMQKPDTIADVVAAAIAEFLQTDNGQAILSAKLLEMATEAGFTVPVLSNDIDSSSETTAATSKAVRTVFNRLKLAENDLESLQSSVGAYTPISETHSVSTATSMAYTGVSITIPAKSYFNVSAVAHYDSTKPKIVGFYEYTASSSNAVETCSAPVGNYNAVVSFSGYSGENARTLHVYAAYESSGQNNIDVSGWYKNG